jgi:competence protein ComEA
VRALLDADDPAARTPPLPGARHAVSPGADTGPWRPGDDLDSPAPDPSPPRSPAVLRWNPGRRGAAALGIAAVAVLAAIGWWLAAARPHAVPLSTSSSLPAGSSMVASEPSAAASVHAEPSAATSQSSAEIVVDVAGRVVHPGIYRLRSGARVYDALEAAGGPRRGVRTVSLNLAAPLQDGQQIVVGSTPGAVPAAPGSGYPGSPAAASSGPLVDVNTATLEQLETLPGVGPVLGQNILDYRSANGAFSSVDQLDEVSGIGPATLSQLRPLVTV